MSIIKELCQYVSCKDKILYTILVHDHTNEELIDIVKKKLENINKKISNSFKKKLINDKIYSFINYLESEMNRSEKVNSIFLINDKINRIDMSLSEKSFCKNWNISKFTFEFDEEFKIDYLMELLSTKMIKCVFKFDKSSYSVVHLDSTKSKVIENHSSLNEDSIITYINQHKPVVIYGMCSILKKLSHLESKNLSILNRHMTNDEILEFIRIKNIEFNQEVFKTEFLDNINNPALLDKLIFGKKNISEAINNFLIKKLFINPKLYKILKNNADSSTLNFEIIIVQSLKSGDFGHDLNKNYNGMVGIKYY